jgi:hypothetical protein
MAANLNPIFVETAETAAQDIANADGTTVQDLVTAGADGARVFAVQASTDETANRDLTLYLQRDGAGTNYPLGSVQVPLGAGTSSSVAGVNLLDATKLRGLDVDGSLILGGGDKLRVAPTATVTSGKTIWVTAHYGDY